MAPPTAHQTNERRKESTVGKTRIQCWGWGRPIAQVERYALIVPSGYALEPSTHPTPSAGSEST